MGVMFVQVRLLKPALYRYQPRCPLLVAITMILALGYLMTSKAKTAESPIEVSYLGWFVSPLICDSFYVLSLLSLPSFEPSFSKSGELGAE
tara:strand:- start:152 stop:424 length:273 start_codon:yes stop_codon:yes gene_type:complete